MVNTYQFRPSLTKKSIVLATKPRRKELSHTKVQADLIRFDVDPRIGRDVLLYICIGFQSAVKSRRAKKDVWIEAFDRGDVDQGKDLIQKYIEGNRASQNTLVIIM